MNFLDKVLILWLYVVLDVVIVLHARISDRRCVP